MDSPEYCGVGIRGVSMLVDSFVWLVAYFLALFLVGAGTGQVETAAASAEVALEGVPALLAIGLFLALGIGYHAVLEARYGQTIGKRLVKIEVTTAEGDPLDPEAALRRNVARLVDFLPALYLLGIAFVVRSERKQRLGDRLAETVVVRA